MGLVAGVETALKRFSRGEKSRLKVKSRYAYGAEGCAEHNIPVFTDLVYEVQLEEFVKVNLCLLHNELD